MLFSDLIEWYLLIDEFLAEDEVAFEAELDAGRCEAVPAERQDQNQDLDGRDPVGEVGTEK